MSLAWPICPVLDGLTVMLGVACPELESTPVAAPAKAMEPTEVVL
jgi:hypothetical protein